MNRHKTALVVWGVAVAVYAVAVAGRTSFGVAGLSAIDRFNITAATLSLFTIVQVGVYAAAQLPVGLLLDRFGARMLLGCGAMILAVGQVGMALTDTVGWALVARFLIGLGDATAFTSVIRLVPSWFSPRRAPLITQLTGIMGGFGQFISSLPFAFALAHVGWAPAFSALSVIGVVAAAAAFGVIRDAPGGGVTGDAAGPGDVVTQTHPTIGDTLREPATWLGFWTHWTCNFPLTVFTLLWGVPFLQIHNGYGPAVASALLVVITGSGMVFGPLIGELTARHRLRRVWLVNAAAIMVLLAWGAVIILPAPAPGWLTILLLLTISFAGPASSIGFDFSRTAIPVSRLGTANGVINTGGFIASLMSAGLIGLVLDWSAAGEPLSAGDFKIAMSTQLLAWAIGMLNIELYRRRARKNDAAHGIVVPPLAEVAARYRSRARGSTRGGGSGL